MVISTIALIYSLYNIFIYGFFSPWVGAVIAILPTVIYIVIHMSRMLARTSENLWTLLIFSAFGTVIVSILPGPKINAFYLTAIVSLLGNLIYVFWYSQNNRPYNPLFKVGSILPEFSLKTIDNELLTSSYIISNPSLLLFYRGNWCPICMAQIRELSEISEKLYDSGITIYLIGAQSMNETKKIADRYSDTPMQFLFDPYMRALTVLNLVHLNGKPKGMFGFERDTAYPTVLFTAKGGEILWTDQSDNYRVRPKSEIFLDLKANIEMT